MSAYRIYERAGRSHAFVQVAKIPDDEHHRSGAMLVLEDFLHEHLPDAGTDYLVRQGAEIWFFKAQELPRPPQRRYTARPQPRVGSH